MSNETEKDKKVETENEPIIGIDLGTTHSCVSIIKNGKVEIIEDKLTGERRIPSMVCFKEKGEKLIGGSAKNNMLQYPESTIFDSKRLIGLKFKNKNVQKDIKNWPFKVVEDKKTEKPKYIIKIGKEEKEHFPEDIASIILNYIKEYAEKSLEGKSIKKAIITVPANFENNQRTVTIEAANKVGLDVIQVLNEPTAAAIAYGDIIKTNKERNVLIFDLGGGTFDVTILKNKDSEYNVLASIGEQHLGGEDFNQRLIKHIISIIKKNDKFKNINFDDKKDEKVVNSLKKIYSGVENLKIELSNMLESKIFIDYLYGIEDFTLKITRKEYEGLCMDLWEKCIKKVDEALKLTKLEKNQIDDIILVGGSTRTPKIREMVEKYFNGKKPLQTINPDEVVAYGAILTSSSKLIINDNILTKSIGINVGTGKISALIPVGAKIPDKKAVSFKKNFSLLADKKQVINIYEGNSENPKDNEILGKLEIDNKELKNKVIIGIVMTLYPNLKIRVQLLIDNTKKKEIEIELTKSIIGIDIGTSTSCIAIMNHNKVDLIPDIATGERIIQSVECLTDDNYLFGKFAINNMIKYAKSTIFQNQRIFGLTNLKDRKYSKNPFIKLINESNNIKYLINMDNNEKKYSSEEVLEDNLKYIKNNIDVFTKNREMKKTIITYPEYLNNAQQDKIIKIAQKVGFKGVELIKVSEASAHGYKNIIRSTKEKNVIIFNLGGGTFEVSIVQINGNKHKTLSFLCLNDLGGEDFHEILMKYILEEIKKKDEFKNMNFDDINDIKILRAYLKIIQETEKLKQKLSSEKESKFEILELNGNDNCILKIERQKYEELCLPLWNKCLDKVEEALKKANLKKENIDEITLIGGCTRTPKIQQMIEERFNKKPLQNVNAEEIVAQGAVYSHL